MNQDWEECLTTLDELEQRIKRSDTNVPPLPFDVNKHRPKEGNRELSSNIILRCALDIIALAFQSGRTRISSLMFGNALSSYDYSPVIEGMQHELHSMRSAITQDHRKNWPSTLKINQYHTKLYADFLTKLDSMQEGEGSVLDNTLVFMGSSMQDGNAHKPINLPILFEKW